MKRITCIEMIEHLKTLNTQTNPLNQFNPLLNKWFRAFRVFRCKTNLIRVILRFAQAQAERVIRGCYIILVRGCSSRVFRVFRCSISRHDDSHSSSNGCRFPFFFFPRAYYIYNV